MYKIIGALFFTSLISFSTWAGAKESGQQMEEFKQNLAQHIDNEIVILTQFKTCIQAAQSRPDFEACKNAKNDSQQKQMLEMRSERLENRKKALASEEKQLNNAAKTERK